ncbi:hypothetical protein BHE74_00051241 [Ensete ventricosum]|nr:hypothetical protein BHE74_00051241 [Ensete ventricosum]RZS05218.1 hypothetical protein BHM03_00035699 [Ensete ventricosum]
MMSMCSSAVGMKSYYEDTNEALNAERLGGSDGSMVGRSVTKGLLRSCVKWDGTLKEGDFVYVISDRGMVEERDGIGGGEGGGPRVSAEEEEEERVVGTSKEARARCQEEGT